MEAADLERLLGFRKRFGEWKICLEKVLGGGATAVVFLGVDPDNPENRTHHVAVKIAKAEEGWRQALTREWRNLRTLAEAEDHKGTHYFPRVLYPDSEEGLRQDERLAGEWATFYILVQELVPGVGVHDLLLDYPGLRLPEPLALEIARQYAEMLIVLHAASLTCADRKLADLRWQRAYDLRPGDGEALARWSQEPPGHLMVLDWNVTEAASPGPHGTVTLDLFRFGILWHRILLGIEPRFRRGAGWQLEEPLEKHPLWPQLSFGTRQILSRLLHPVPDSRYREATDLLHDTQAQIRRWQADVRALEDGFRPLYRRYVEEPISIWQAEAKRALAGADVLRVRIAAWDERRPPEFDNVHRSLQRAVVDAPFHSLREAMHKSQWDEVEREIERLWKGHHDPAHRLHLDRQRQIAARAKETGSSWRAVEDLFDQSDLIFNFDRPGGMLEKKELTDIHVSRWQKEAETESDDDWRGVRDRLWQEAGYRLALDRARILKEQDGFPEALATFQNLQTLRERLSRHRDQIITWLDQLYGDPTTELASVRTIVEAGKDRAGAFERGVRAFLSGAELERAVVGFAAVLRADPDNAVLAHAYRLLEAEQSYRRARQARNVLTEIRCLGQLLGVWKELADAAGSSTDGELKRAWNEVASQMEESLTQRERELGDRVLTRIGIYFPERALSPEHLPGSQPDEVSTRLLVQTYLEAFKEEHLKKTVEDWLRLSWDEENASQILEAIRKRRLIQRETEAKIVLAFHDYLMAS